MRSVGRSIWQIAATAGAHRVPTAIGSVMTLVSVAALALAGRFGIMAWVALGLLAYMTALVWAYHDLRLDRDRLAAVVAASEGADKALLADLGSLVAEMRAFWNERERGRPPVPSAEAGKHVMDSQRLYAERFETRAFWMADRLLRRGFIDREQWERIAHPRQHSAQAGIHWLEYVAKQTGAA